MAYYSDLFRHFLSFLQTGTPLLQNKIIVAKFRGIDKGNFAEKEALPQAALR